MNRSLGLILMLLTATTATATGPASKPAQAAVTVSEAGSTTIIGEQDSAMGLYLTPWKEEFASGMDQAPSLYRAPMAPLDEGSLRRQTEYRNALSSYRRNHTQRSP